MSEQLDFNRAVRINPESHNFDLNLNLHGVFQLQMAEERNADTVGGVCEVVVNSEVENISLVLSGRTADTLPWPHQDLQKEYFESSGDVFYTAYGSAASNAKLKRNRDSHVLSLQEPHRLSTHALPERVRSEDAAMLLKSYEPEEVFLYSGAGISAANVWTHEEAARRAGFILFPDTVAEYAQNRIFAKDFLSDPSAAHRVKGAFSTLQRQRREAEPTSAHYAFSNIVSKLGDLPLTATTNTHYAHDKTGLVVPWVQSHQTQLVESKQAREAAFGKELKRRAKNIGLIVAIGISDDSKDVMKYIREQNPQASVLALNNGDRAKLTYMQSGDMIVSDNCQTSLPEIAHILGRLN